MIYLLLFSIALYIFGLHLIVRSKDYKISKGVIVSSIAVILMGFSFAVIFPPYESPIKAETFPTFASYKFETSLNYNSNIVTVVETANIEPK